ncbi:MAG: MFS transporter, partial [Sphingomonadales bacterium]|nr:MFS transporter [Sphingomonadales bacterium]MBD3774285.1 MFS transporter [Paracoccaceae bacterium]
VRAQVAKEDLPQAIALNSIAFNIARSVGPALGGLLIGIFNIALAFTINAVSYIAMIFALLRWKPEFTRPEMREGMLAAIGRGLSHCARTSVLRRIILRGFAIGFGIAAYQALIPLLAREQMHGGESDFGLLLGAFGLGSIATALVVRKALRRWGPEAVVSASSMVIAAGLLGLSQAHSIGPAIALTFLMGTGWTGTMTSLNVAMQLRSPDEILGRCMATFQATTFGGMALGAWAWGALSDASTLPVALQLGAAWLLGTLVFARLFGPMPARGEGHVTS